MRALIGAVDRMTATTQHTHTHTITHAQWNIHHNYHIHLNSTQTHRHWHVRSLIHRVVQGRSIHHKLYTYAPACLFVCVWMRVPFASLQSRRARSRRAGWHGALLFRYPFASAVYTQSVPASACVYITRARLYVYVNAQWVHTVKRTVCVSSFTDARPHTDMTET